LGVHWSIEPGLAQRDEHLAFGSDRPGDVPLVPVDNVLVGLGIVVESGANVRGVGRCDPGFRPARPGYATRE
jgi:hypothetical protein